MYPKGEVRIFRMQDWRDPILGQVLAMGADWVLLRHVPIDFVQDGYKLLKRDLIAEAKRTSVEERIERVFALRGWKAEPPTGMPLTHTLAILDWIERHYHFFQIQDEDESMVMIGRIHHLRDDNTLVLDSVDEDGLMSEASEPGIPLDQLRTIEFGTDYLDATYRLWKAQQAD